MRRVRWFGVTWPFSMWTLAKRLKELPFEGERTVGMVVDRARQDHVEGRFFEQVIFQETVHDPRGTEYQVERVTFNSLGFRCSTSFPQLQIMDAPRSIKPFLNLLGEATGFESTVDPLSVDLGRWISALQSQCPDDFRLDAVRLAEFALNENARARVEILSLRDVREERGGPFQLETRRFDRAQVRFQYLSQPVSLVLSQDSSLRSDTEFPAELADIARSAFITSWDDESGQGNEPNVPHF